jgi:hypothetical protein
MNTYPEAFVGKGQTTCRAYPGSAAGYDCNGFVVPVFGFRVSSFEFHIHLLFESFY